MDKFTVDLDQVLNDFEYSELTDQYNTSKVLPEHSSTQGVIKHSINNVFHSLNEYLNTNVHSIETVDRVDESLEGFKENLLEINDNNKSIEGPKTEQRFNNYGEFSQHFFVDSVTGKEDKPDTNIGFVKTVENQQEKNSQVANDVETLTEDKVFVGADLLAKEDITNTVEPILVDAECSNSIKETDKELLNNIDDEIIKEGVNTFDTDVDHREQEDQHISLQVSSLSIFIILTYLLVLIVCIKNSKIGIIC